MHYMCSVHHASLSPNPANYYVGGVDEGTATTRDGSFFLCLFKIFCFNPFPACMTSLMKCSLSACKISWNILLWVLTFQMQTLESRFEENKGFWLAGSCCEIFLEGIASAAQSLRQDMDQRASFPCHPGAIFRVILAFSPSANPVWLTGHYKGSVFHVILVRVFHVSLAFSPSANPVWLTGRYKGWVFHVILAFSLSANPVWFTEHYKGQVFHVIPGRVFHVILAFSPSANPRTL